MLGFVLQIWMLTGDKLETATCIAKSSKLVSRTQDIYTFKKVTGRTEAHLELNNLRRKQDTALVITGDSLQVFTCCRNSFARHNYCRVNVTTHIVLSRGLKVALWVD